MGYDLPAGVPVKPSAFQKALGLGCTANCKHVEQQADQQVQVDQQVQADQQSQADVDLQSQAGHQGKQAQQKQQRTYSETVNEAVSQHCQSSGGSRVGVLADGRIRVDKKTGHEWTRPIPREKGIQGECQSRE